MPKQISIPKEAKKKEIKRNEKEFYNRIAFRWLVMYKKDHLLGAAIDLIEDQNSIEI